MAYYRVCPKCGSNLDPGEECDCDSKNSKICIDDIEIDYSSMEQITMFEVLKEEVIR